ncbi:MFS transporter [Nitratidesulfovibrio sp. D1]|uniref:MFS transporter n=1 Tax=Nitratidesulfovibrio sp. D1 TaxID=3440151 RepID=UPI003EB6DD53
MPPFPDHHASSTSGASGPSGTPNTPGGSSGPLRVFRHRNYRLFFGGQAISLPGTWMQSMAQSWLVYRLSESSFVLGALGFAAQLPLFALSVFGGALADSHDRRAILVGTQVASMLLALTAAALTMTDLVQVWHVFVLATALGMVNAFDVPTRQSFVMDMVGRKDLPTAIGLNSSMFNAARVIGPTLAGLMVAAAGEGWCFLLNGVSFVPVIAGLLMMRLPAHVPPPPGPSTLQRIREGLGFAVRHEGIRTTLLLVGATSLIAVNYSVLMPVVADKVLGGNARTLGLLLGAAGAGALLGALCLASRRDSKGLFRWTLYAAMGLGASLTAFALCRSVWTALLALVPVGMGMVVLMASANTLLQIMSPDAYRGRVMALFSMMFLGMGPFGSLLGGAMAQALGPSTTLLLSGIMCLGNALWFGLWLRRRGDGIEDMARGGNRD